MKIDELLLNEMNDGEWSAREDDMMQSELSDRAAGRKAMNAMMPRAPEIHQQLMNDPDYMRARAEDDYVEMQLVLQANGFYDEYDFANYMLKFNPKG